MAGAVGMEDYLCSLGNGLMLQVLLKGIITDRLQCRVVSSCAARRSAAFLKLISIRSVVPSAKLAYI